MRFKDQGYSLYNFIDEIWVHCPKCDKKATIHNITDHSARFFKPFYEIYCEFCGYYDKNNKVYYDINLKRNCPECGKKFEFNIQNVKEKKQNLKIPCPHCRFSESYQPTHVVHYGNYFSFNDNENFCFNSRFWLQKPFRGNVFFAYNGRHLSYLKDFISADMRESYSAHFTHISRLPAFIKAKKNRQSLLKIIRQLEKKAFIVNK